MSALAAATVAALSVISGLLVRRVRTLHGDVSELSARVQELSDRLENAQQDVAGTLARAGVVESLLLDKGLADEEDLEAARRRFGEEPREERTGELH
jgi:hypothetical protein